MSMIKPKDAPFVEDPNDHLGIIFVETGRLMAKYHGIDREEILSEFYIILHRCCQLFDPSMGFTFATYAHEACRVSRGNVICRIKTGKRSPDQMKFDDALIPFSDQMSFDASHVSYHDDWQAIEQSENGMDQVDDQDELDFLLAEASETHIDVLVSNTVRDESQKSIGKRIGKSRAAVSKMRVEAIKIAREAAEDHK